MNTTEVEDEVYETTYILWIVFGIILFTLCCFKLCGLYWQKDIEPSSPRKSQSGSIRRESRMFV